LYLRQQVVQAENHQHANKTTFVVCGTDHTNSSKVPIILIQQFFVSQTIPRRIFGYSVQGRISSCFILIPFTTHYSRPIFVSHENWLELFYCWVNSPKQGQALVRRWYETVDNGKI